MSMIAQKNRNKKFSKRVQKIFFKKNFFRPKIFKKPLFLAIFGRKNGKDKNFWSKIFFWSESIQNGPKRILKRKSRFRKKHCDFSLLSLQKFLTASINRKISKECTKMWLAFWCEQLKCNLFEAFKNLRPLKHQPYFCSQPLLTFYGVVMGICHDLHF